VRGSALTIMTDIVYKPLDASVNKDSPKDDKMSWQKICLLYGRRITASKSVSGLAVATLYIVPTGKLFLLTHGNLSAATTGAGIFNALLAVSATDTGGGIDIDILRIEIEGSGSSCPYSPTVPLRCIAGEKINVDSSNAALEASACVTGYEIDADIFYKLM